ncbi:LuxR C-terminal-related transcriptional regulator, partial [Escherichia coli]|uniref:LuxR C-terminal-related transcriptional regulator n=1 Tax=Escherichia coli TaxID=562 RepID=UPI003BA153C6
GKNSLNRLIRCVCGKKIGPDPRNFNQRVSLGRNDLLIRTFLNQSRTLSPTEREILRFMSRGYSMTQIAEQLKRNIKTIRAHKFNVMSKLGVSSDAGLLEAADILLCMRHCEASNVLHPY